MLLEGSRGLGDMDKKPLPQEILLASLGDITFQIPDK